MTDAGRRKFLISAGGLTTWPLLTPLVRAAELLPERKSARAVVVGGGFAGAIAAKSLRLANPLLEVVLVERNRTYSALPGANWLLSGARRIGENRLAYDRLAGTHGIKMVFGEAITIDPGKRQVILRDGTIEYDHVVIAPGIDFRFEDIEGYDPATTPDLFPHAWTSGEDVAKLKRRIDEMRDGGVVVVSLPPLPYRCPQAAYERISQIAFLLKQTKPKAKIIVLDGSPSITELGELFLAGWQRDYKNLIDYRSGQIVTRADTSRSSLITRSETVRGDVINLIPPQQAGALAHAAGLLGPDKRWCPIDFSTQESTVVSGIYVIGDACHTPGMQKSASTANAQGKLCGLALSAQIGRRKPQPSHYANIVYSLINDREAASTVNLYRGDGHRLEAIDKAGGNSPSWSESEAEHARSWLNSILVEMSG